MTNSRPFIILALEEAFKDPKKAKEIRETTLKTITERPGSVSRIFDKFPSLLPIETMQDISKKCLNILSNMEVDSITFDANGIHVHNKIDQENISSFIKEIISIGMKELLDNKGHITMELIKLLELESLNNQLKQFELIVSILCGYVGAINQEIIVHLSKEIVTLNPAYTGFSGYLNKKSQPSNNFETNVRRWVIDKYNETSYAQDTPIQNKDHKTDTNNLLRRPREIPPMGSLIVLSAINEASDVMFFNKKTSSHLYLKTNDMKRNNLT